MALRLAVILLFLFTQNVFGQVESLEKWKGAYETLLEQAPLEIIHIHTDREHYTIGDTIWYKTYVLNGHKRGVSQISGIVYVELVDHLGKSVLTHRKHLIAGATAGYINFPKELTPGSILVKISFFQSLYKLMVHFQRLSSFILKSFNSKKTTMNI
jgi:hypothetical protein